MFDHVSLMNYLNLNTWPITDPMQAIRQSHIVSYINTETLKYAGLININPLVIFYPGIFRLGKIIYQCANHSNIQLFS